MDTDELIESLRDGDESVRREAVCKLGSLGSEKALKALVEALGDESWLVRETAVEAILRSGGTSGISFFLAVMKDKDARVRNSAIEILTGLEGVAVNALVKLLDDKDESIIRYTADCLGDIGDRRAVGPLIDALQKSGGDVRYRIIIALGKIGDKSAVDHLIPCLDEDLWIQTAAIDALGNIGDHRAVKRILDLMKENIFLAAPAAEALGRIGALEALPDLLENLGQENKDILSATVKALVRIRDRNRKSDRKDYPALNAGRGVVIDGILNILDSDDPELRASAAVLLGWLKAEGAIEHLTGLLKDVNDDVCQKAGESLVQFGTASVDSLLDFMDIPEKRAKLLAIKALEDIGDRRAAASAAKFLGDANEDDDIKVAVIKLIAKTVGDGAFDMLVDLLDHPVGIIRTAAVNGIISSGIGKAGRKRLLSMFEEAPPERKISLADIVAGLRISEAAEDLWNLLHDKDARVRQHAVFALAEIEGNKRMNSIPLMLLGSEDPVTRKTAAMILGRIRDRRGVVPLRITAKDPDQWVRYQSVRALGMIGDERGADSVRKAINDPVGAVRIAAIDALTEISPCSITEDILNMDDEKDEDVRQAFLEALHHCGKESSRPVFMCAAADPSWKVREAATRGLGIFDDEESTGRIRRMLEDENIFIRETAKEILEKKRHA